MRLPNALAPTVQAIALTFAYLAGGVVVVEYIFGYPGSAKVWLTRSPPRPAHHPADRADAGAFYVLVNIIADVVVILVTPKLGRRHRGGTSHPPPATQAVAPHWLDVLARAGWSAGARLGWRW